MSFNEVVKKYEKQGYTKRIGKNKSKLAEYAILYKEGTGVFGLGYDGIFLYHVDDDVTLAHANDFLKRYKQVYDDKNFSSNDKGIISYTGKLNTKEFRTLAKSLLDSYQYNCLKLQQEKGAEKKTVKEKTSKSRPKRKKLAKASQSLILRSQHHLCAMCRADITKLPVHFDHRIPLAMGGADEIENIQALCPNCHAIKTQQDSLAISRARK